MSPIEYTLIVYSPNGKGIVLGRIIFGSGDRDCKRKHYRKWARMLPVVFEDFEMVYIFSYFFLFTSIVNW